MSINLPKDLRKAQTFPQGRVISNPGEGSRCGVAHGDSKKANKKREIAINDNETVPTIKAATDYLRMALGILLEYPDVVA